MIRNETLEEVAKWHDERRATLLETKQYHLDSPSMKTPGHEVHVQYCESYAEFHRYAAEAVRLMKDK